MTMNVRTPGRVELVSPFRFGLALRRARDHEHAEQRDRRRGEEDPAPADVLGHQTAEERGEAGTAPGAHGPQRDRALAGGPIPVRLHEGEAGRHDERAGQPLEDAAEHQEGRGKAARRREPDQQRADDAEDEADLHDLHAAKAIGQAADRRR